MCPQCCVPVLTVLSDADILTCIWIVNLYNPN